MTLSKKIVIVLLVVILAAVFFSIKTARVHAADIWYEIYQWVVLPLLRMVAQKLDNIILNKLGVATSGVLGNSPHFITNWRNNILSSQARGNDLFRSILADATLCPYFNNGLKTAFGAEKYVGTMVGTIVKNVTGQVTYQNQTYTPGLPSFQNLANCTLPSNFNINTFQNDFAKGGGWDVWNQLIQPQNNFFGVYAMALSEQQKQIALENQANTNQNIANQGYLPNKVGTNTASGGQKAGSSNFDYGACIDTCSSAYNTCLKQPTGGEVTAAEWCSAAMNTCDSSCLKQQQTASQQSTTSSTASVNGCTETLPGTSRCISEGKIVTPGNIYNQVSGARISKQTTTLQDAQSIGDIIQWLVSDVASKLAGQIDNMLGVDIFSNAVNNGMYQSTDYENQLNQVQGQINQSGQAGSSATCRQQCSDRYNNCLRQPTADETAASENQAACSAEMTDCDATCPP